MFITSANLLVLDWLFLFSVSSKVLGGCPCCVHGGTSFFTGFCAALFISCPAFLRVDKLLFDNKDYKVHANCALKHFLTPLIILGFPSGE